MKPSCIVLAAAMTAALAASASAQTPAAPPAPPPAPAPPHPMGWFISSSAPVGSGALGGLAGADKVCQSLAAAVGAGNRTWRAYLSTQTSRAGPGVNARDRIGAGPWYNAKNTLIAANVEDLHGDVQRDRNNIQAANDLNEKGEVVDLTGAMMNKHDVLTGSDSDGRAFPAGLDTTCNNWTSDTDDHKAMVGHFDRTGGQNTSWNSSHLSVSCAAPKLFANGYAGHLYCFAAD